MIKLSNQAKLDFISNLGTLLTAGIPILESVDSLSQESDRNRKKILESIKFDLSEGKSLSEAFSKFKDTFDLVTINLVKVAEESGTLEMTLKDIASSLKKEIEFNEKVKGALTYPTLVLVVFFGVMTLILTFVIPRIATVFGRLRVTLPLPTKILIYVSDILINSTPYVIAFLLLIFLGLYYLYVYKKKALINILFSLPLLSKLAIEIDLTRFTHNLHLMLNSGVPIIKALELIKQVMVTKKTETMVQNAYDYISNGKKLSEGLKSIKNVAPNTMIVLVESGEKSGTLEESMKDLSEYFESRVSKNLKSVTTLIEPIMLVVVGLLIGGMMLAIIAPIYGLIGQIGGR